MQVSNQHLNSSDSISSYAHLHNSEIAALAAECGIDWSRVNSVRPGKQVKLPVIAKKYQGKCAMWVEEKTAKSGQSYTQITFHTQKHGGVTRVWSSYEKKDGLDRLPRLVRHHPAQVQQQLKQQEEQRQANFLKHQTAWQKAERAESSAYLKRKGILQILEHAEIKSLSDAAIFGRGSDKPYLAFELKDPKGQYVGLQKIYDDGQKKLSSAAHDGAYKGAFAVLGDLDSSDVIYFAEGFATAASIFLATGKASVFAYSATNLEAVVCSLAKIYRDDSKTLIIAADNDHKGLDHNNPGLYAAWRAAYAASSSFSQCQIQVAMPTLIDGKKTDFNDIHLAYGLGHLAECLNKPSSLPRLRLDYLIKLLAWAGLKEGQALIQQITGFNIPKTEQDLVALTETLFKACGERWGRVFIRKQIVRVCSIIKRRAANLFQIQPDHVADYSRHLLEYTPKGHPTIGEKTLGAIQDKLDQGHIVILKAPMGVGKTEIAIRSAIDRVEKGAVVLPRVSVVDDAALRLGIDNYQNCDPRFTDKMAVCVNSLGAKRFKRTEECSWFDHLELLCLDEASQLFPQVVSLGSNLQRQANHQALVYAIKTAAKVLITDADANEFLIAELKRITDKPITVFEVDYNEADRKRWDIVYSTDLQQAKKSIIQAVSEKETVLVAIDSKNQAKEITALLSHLCPTARVLNIYRDLSEQDKEKALEFYQNPNQVIQGYDVLIYSPVITSGVSITEPHFTRHFGLFTGTVRVGDMVQMMGRDRTSLQWHITISKRRFRDFSSYQPCSAFSSLSLFHGLTAASEAYEKMSRNDLDALAFYSLELKGHRLSLCPLLQAKRDRGFAKFSKDIRLGLKKDKVDLILSQQDITEEEYTALGKKWLPTLNDSAALTAYRIRHKLCAKVNEESIAFFLGGGLKKQELFETLFAPTPALEELDRQEALIYEPILRQCASEKQRVMQKVIKLLGLDQDFQGEFTHRHCQGVVDYVLGDASRLNLLFSGLINPKAPPRCPTRFVMRFLARLGLRLETRKSMGRMIRFINREDVLRMRQYAKGRYQHKQGFAQGLIRGGETPP